ncbi:MAG: hypothetical protein LBU47_03325 [Christensenellaceae bacterium]|jgi:hypothetical protein|nr:hypothetical protein [Christensenellaceae bacterium]
MKKEMRKAGALLLGIALLFLALPQAGAVGENGGGPYYIIYPNDDSAEIVDRNGNPPPEWTRELLSAVRLAPRGPAGAASRDVGFELTARPQISMPGENQAEGAETAFMTPDGSLLFEFEAGVWYDCPADGFVLRYETTAAGWPKAVLADLQSGERIDLSELTPGKALGWIRGGEGGWIAYFYSIGEAESSWLYFLGQDFEIQAELPCQWAEMGYWAGESVLLYATEKDEKGPGAMFVEDLGRNILWKSENRDETWAYFTVDDQLTDQLAVGQNARGPGFVNRQSGEIEWLDLAAGEESKPLGGLKTRRDAEGWKVVGEDGALIASAQEEYNVSYDDSSPILVQGWSNEAGSYQCAVYSRTGEVLRPLGPAPSGSKVLEGYGNVFVPESDRLVLYLAGGGKQTLPFRGVPQGAKLSSVWLGSWAGGWALQMDFQDGAGNYLQEGYAALLKADGSGFLTDQVYANAWKFNDSQVESRLCQVTEQRGWQALRGLVDEGGQTVLPPRYKLLRGEGELYSVRYGRYYGLIDEKGSWIVRRTTLSSLQD